ncbi:stage III sporulation protein AF [Oceanobacillus oncorhynchi subsp. incaldanensis]|uniref:Stage III sporulation protein AF (Spore_III_AF) n=2 Tax=Oceanobacillus TaxID=182709 RepID=A0A0A1MZB6_9BACI|nr:stage III sporulation protein AF [Oceanobacillus oncorhynchi]MDM8099451.1 stage III sporulation protein AF [Oceanobacillus oncorhynchi]UUI38425.1 stage III sporulation protein AF [Oceanobacillus oncorhynchi]GIO20974.1 stage III sporulation protein AF [Oceanobacillus oncorhynchi subsp. incaldanensis]CEI84106.1 Stage III sporulation protein AF (Spore_III_AF) [Oceanobacillus oncorhynchi]
MRIEIFTDWVTQIILFIILASVIDLLVPANHLQKYVRLAISLILILILLQPVFYLFNTDINTAISSSMNKIESQFQGQPSIENQIDLEKKEIESGQDAYILEQMAIELEKIAAEPLKEEFNAEIASIDFQFSVMDSVSYEELTEVIVYITESEPGEGAMNTVEDVVIEWGNEEETHSEEPLQEMEASLKEIWEIEDKEITVYWEGEGF